jgi:peptidoglycan/xylan/chitin deacetylase (PgdA/CDA1 family)
VRVKAWLRDLAGDLLLRTGLTSPARRGAGQLTIATFHRVLPEAQRAEYPMPGLVVTPAELEWFLGFLSRHYRVGPLRECAEAWASDGAGDRPRLALTFDDAPLDNFVHGRPVLERAGLRATFFAPAGSVDRDETLWHDRLAYAVARAWTRQREAALRVLRDLGVGIAEGDAVAAARALVHAAKNVTPAERGSWIEQVESRLGRDARPDWDGLMSWEQLAGLAADGHEIGSHSLTHALLPQCDAADLEREVAGSRRLLEERLGLDVVSFCYPNGDFDERTVDAVAKAGYRLGVTTAWGVNAPDVDRFRLARYEMQGDHARRRNGALSEARLAWRMTSFHPGLGG